MVWLRWVFLSWVFVAVDGHIVNRVFVMHRRVLSVYACVLFIGCAGVGGCERPSAPQPPPPPSVETPKAVEVPKAAAALRSGPMLGYNTQREVLVWAQLSGEGAVQVRYWKQGDSADQGQISAPVNAAAQEDFVTKITLSDLQPGTRYDYDILIDGQAQARPYALTFQTQPLWQWRTDPPALKVAFGSCHYANDPPFDRPGKAWGEGFGIFDQILSQKPDLMLWLGDNVYLREVDWTSAHGIASRHAWNREQQPLQALLASVHHLAIWDDHDFGPNDSDRSFILRDESLALFKRYWGNQTYGRGEAPGVYGQFSWGDVDFFLLDNRYHRAPVNAPDTAEKHLLGPVQMQWLIDSLTASRATFKVIVSGGQVLNPLVVYENWTRHATERQQLLDALRDRQITGVVFLSGDRHHGELIRLDREGLYSLYDFTSSPLTAGVGSGDPENAARVPGTLVLARHFGLLSFEGAKDARTLTMKALDAEGKTLWAHTLRAADLR